jgi:acyl-CoA reductase-like NAD-dependent aldehyde dehydrogenase
MQLLPGSGRVVTGGVGDERDRYVAPTVLVDVAPDSPVMSDEIFGPILPVSSSTANQGTLYITSPTQAAVATVENFLCLN